MDIGAIIGTIVAWLPKITILITACAAIAALTPSKSDDRILQIILDIINKIGLNIGKAKNADDK